MNNPVNVVTVVQARMSSTRLPYKVMMSLVGKPLLYRMVERIKNARFSGQVVVATSLDKSDDAICNYCEREQIDYFRGSLDDLLDRHFQVGLKYNADAVVKIPSDCPLIDSNVINKVIHYYLSNIDKYDFVSNLHPATYPDGNDVEIMSMDALKLAHSEATRPLEREHTTPYFWENPDKFRIGNVEWETGYDYSMSHRWTIDYEEDYLFIKAIYDELYPHNPHFSMYDVLNLVERHPEIKALNNRFAGVNWYRNHLDELKTISAEQTKIL